jgi:hypothetical protein
VTAQTRRRGSLPEFLIALGMVGLAIYGNHGKLPNFSAAVHGSVTRAEAALPALRHDGRAVTATGPAACGCTVTTMPGNGNEQLANRIAAADGWSRTQRTCLDLLWSYESAHSWSPTIANPTSGAYGIPQALPGGKMAAAGGDWQTNPATQIRWGLGYITATYGSPCGAWQFELSNNSY